MSTDHNQHKNRAFRKVRNKFFGSARGFRGNRMVPGVLYGGGQDPLAICLNLNEVVKAIDTGQFLTSTANLVHDGKKHLVIPQAIQMHTVTDQPVHVDLYRVEASQVISVEVPVHFHNEDKAPGLKRGGALNVVRHAIELNVRADSIPDSIEIDLTGLTIGDTVKISNIKLPEGARPTITDRDFTIATIAEDREASENEETSSCRFDLIAADCRVQSIPKMDADTASSLSLGLEKYLRQYKLAHRQNYSNVDDPVVREIDRIHDSIARERGLTSKQISNVVALPDNKETSTASATQFHVKRLSERNEKSYDDS